MTAGQPLDLEAELAQSFSREVNLPVFKGIFVAAADNERKPIPIGPEQPAKVEPVALRFVIGRKTRCRRSEETERARTSPRAPRRIRGRGLVGGA